MTDVALTGELNVSRETFERLQIFERVIQKWNPRINLVSKSSISDLWVRHIADSVQVFRMATPSAHWVDIGSGGGFPGLIVAILVQDEWSDAQVTLIESDQRKSAFLRTAARECGVQCKVITQRIEQAPPQNADILSARALADLSLLLNFTERHLKPDGTALFSKGRTWMQEVEVARQEWDFAIEPIASLSEDDAAILKIKGVSRV